MGPPIGGNRPTSCAKLNVYFDSEVEGLVRDYLAHKGNNALTKWVTPARYRFRDPERTALRTDDKVALDEMEMFRKDVGTFLRQYDFLSQIVNYEDISREKRSTTKSICRQWISTTSPSTSKAQPPENSPVVCPLGPAKESGTRHGARSWAGGSGGGHRSDQRPLPR